MILGWFSVQLEQNQQQLVKHQFQGLVELQLDAVDDIFQGHFQRLEKAFQLEIETLYNLKDDHYATETLRQLGKSSPYIEQVFIQTSDSETLYPTYTNATQQEIKFLQETQTLLSSATLFNDKQEETNTLTTANTIASRTAYSAQLKSAPSAPRLSISEQQSKIQLDSRNTSASYAQSIPSADVADAITPQAISTQDNIEPTPSGWIAWYNNTKLQHIYWQTTPDGDVIGFSINHARLLSDLINLLPDQSAIDNIPALKNAAITLRNSRGENSYEWGGISTEDIIRLKPIKSKHLSHPIGSWRLDFSTPSLYPTATKWVEKVSIIILTLLGLSFLAWLVYREQTRESRLALQRVNFVNQVSHELKTPLTNVRMYAELLESQLDEEQTKPKRYLDIINNESQRLTRLIENVLSFSKLGRNGLEISRSQGTLKTSVHNTLQAFTPILTQRGLRPSIECDCDDQVMLDNHCIEQILNNLLSNSEKYAADSGTIDIHCWQERDVSYIRVKDNGPGIPATHATRVFNQFYRVSNQLTDGVSGTGIGLSIARELARKHGGDLILEPTDIGASFLLSLHTPSIQSSPDTDNG